MPKPKDSSFGDAPIGSTKGPGNRKKYSRPEREVEGTYLIVRRMSSPHGLTGGTNPWCDFDHETKHSIDGNVNRARKKKGRPPIQRPPSKKIAVSIILVCGYPVYVCKAHEKEFISLYKSALPDPASDPTPNYATDPTPL